MNWYVCVKIQDRMIWYKEPGRETLPHPYLPTYAIYLSTYLPGIIVPIIRANGISIASHCLLKLYLHTYLPTYLPTLPTGEMDVIILLFYIHGF